MHYEPKKEKFKEHKPELPDGFYVWIIQYNPAPQWNPRMIYCQTYESALHLQQDMNKYSDYDESEIRIYTRTALINWAKSESTLLNLFEKSAYRIFPIRSDIQEALIEFHERVRQSTFYFPSKIYIDPELDPEYKVTYPVEKPKEIDEIAEIEIRIQFREKELADADKELDKFLAEADNLNSESMLERVNPIDRILFASMAILLLIFFAAYLLNLPK